MFDMGWDPDHGCSGNGKNFVVEGDPHFEGAFFSDKQQQLGSGVGMHFTSGIDLRYFLAVKNIAETVASGTKSLFIKILKGESGL